MFTLLPTPPLNGKINYPLFFQGELESKLKKKKSGQEGFLQWERRLYNVPNYLYDILQYIE